MRHIRSIIVLGMIPFASSTQLSAYRLYHSGFYGGGELGYIHEDYREKITDSSLSRIKRIKKNANSDKFFPSLSAGYRYFKNCYFLGFELGANLNPSKADVRFRTAGSSRDIIYPSHCSKHRIAGKYNILPAFIFGGETVLKYALFFKVGMDYGKYEYKVFDKIKFKKSKDFSLNRLLLGGGIEYAFNPCWSGRFIIDCSLRKAKTFTSGSTHHYKVQAKIATTALKFGIIAKL